MNYDIERDIDIGVRNTINLLFIFLKISNLFSTQSSWTLFLVMKQTKIILKCSIVNRLLDYGERKLERRI
jgi:hypothetical protein